MGQLYFYSDQVIPANERIDGELFRELDNKHCKIGYIPATGDNERKYCRAKQAYYSRYGVSNLLFFDLGDEFKEDLIDELLCCHVIHLSAGDPMYFHSRIVQRQFDVILRDYFNSGGKLVGVSGGGVQLGLTTALFKMFTSTLTDALNERPNLAGNKTYLNIQFSAISVVKSCSKLPQIVYHI